MTIVELEFALLKHLPRDVANYIERRAKMEQTNIMTIVRERLREVAEFDMRELERMA